MKRSLLLVLFSFIFYLTNGQDTGEKEYPYLGIKFTIPDGWMGQEQEFGYIMGSNTEAGIIMMVTHEATNIEQLKMEAQKGIYEQGGTALQLSSELEPVGEQGVGAHFSGTVEYQPAKAYVAGVINPFGNGVTIMAITDQANYSDRYSQLAKGIATSLKFAHPKESPVVKEWKDALKGAKLTYLSTSGGSDYSGYSGSSSRDEILLCSNQQFNYYSSYSASFDIDAGFGNANSSDGGQGTWEVVSDGGGNALLKLHFNDGRESEYRIDYRDDKTFLNDSRYFRTYDHGECY